MTTEPREPMSGGGSIAVGPKERSDFSITAQSIISLFSCSISKHSEEPTLSAKFISREYKITVSVTYPKWSPSESDTVSYGIGPLPGNTLRVSIEKLLIFRFLETVEGEFSSSDFYKTLKTSEHLYRSFASKLGLLCKKTPGSLIYTGKKKISVVTKQPEKIWRIGTRTPEFYEYFGLKPMSAIGIDTIRERARLHP